MQGDGSSSIVKYIQVDTIQLVWTHDCEHGVINGFDTVIGNEINGSTSLETSNIAVEKGSCFVIIDDYIQIGPEQILARIPIKSTNKIWKDTGSAVWLSQVDFDPDEEMMTC